MKGVLGFCEILSQFPVRVESSHSSCISDIDAAEITLDAGPWNEAESEFEGVEDVCQAACSDSSSAAASKRVGSGSKVSNKDLGEMKEKEKEKRVQSQTTTTTTQQLNNNNNNSTTTTTQQQQLNNNNYY